MAAKKKTGTTKKSAPASKGRAKDIPMAKRKSAAKGAGSRTQAKTATQKTAAKKTAVKVKKTALKKTAVKKTAAKKSGARKTAAKSPRK